MKQFVLTALTMNLFCNANLAFAGLDDSNLKNVSWACDNGTHISLHQSADKPPATDCLAIYEAIYSGVVKPGGAVIGFGAEWYPKLGIRVPHHANAYMIAGSAFIAFDVLDGTKMKRRLLLNMKTNSLMFLSDRALDGSGFKLQYESALKNDAANYAVILQNVEGKKRGPEDKNWTNFNALRGDIGEVVDASKCTLDRPQKNCLRLRGIRADKPNDFYRVKQLYASEADIPPVKFNVDIPLSYPVSVSAQDSACDLFSDRDELVQSISDRWSKVGYKPKSATIKQLAKSDFGPKRFKLYTSVLKAVSEPVFFHPVGKVEDIYITELAPCDNSEDYKATFIIGNASSGKVEAITLAPKRRKQLLNNGLKLNKFFYKLIDRKRFGAKVAHTIVYWLSTTKTPPRIIK